MVTLENRTKTQPSLYVITNLWVFPDYGRRYSTYQQAAPGRWSGSRCRRTWCRWTSPVSRTRPSACSTSPRTTRRLTRYSTSDYCSPVRQLCYVTLEGLPPPLKVGNNIAVMEERRLRSAVHCHASRTVMILLYFTYSRVFRACNLNVYEP